MAPELIDPAMFGLAKFRRTRATDIYSFACVCVEVRILVNRFALIAITQKAVSFCVDLHWTDTIRGDPQQRDRDLTGCA